MIQSLDFDTQFFLSGSNFKVHAEKDSHQGARYVFTFTYIYIYIYIYIHICIYIYTINPGFPGIPESGKVINGWLIGRMPTYF